MSTPNFMHGRGISSRSLTIASVFPRAKRAQRDYAPDMSGGRTIFQLPAAPKGEVSTLTITDCWELIETDRGTFDNMIRRPEMVKVEDIANCLLNEWAVNIAGTREGQRPGIMLIAGDVPTAEEKAKLETMQAAYFDGLVNEAQAYANQHAWKNITDLHRDAAKWRGFDAPWVTNLGEGKEKKHCAYCDEKIQPAAKFCVHCRQWQPGFEAMANAPQPVVEKTESPKPGRPPIPPPVKNHAQAAA